MSPRPTPSARIALLAAALAALAGCSTNDPVSPPVPAPPIHVWEDLALTRSFAQTEAMAEFQGKLYAGGAYFDAAGLQRTSLVSWNGSQWSASASQPNSDILALAVYGDRLIAGGPFLQAGPDTSTHYIAAWDGAAWHPVGGGMDWDVLALAVNGTDLIVGGVFLHAGGVPARFMARWDGTAWHAMGIGPDDAVEALAVYRGEVIAGGFFQTVGGVAAHYIAAWNGAAWRPLGGAADLNGVVRSLYVLHDTLFVGGHFTTAAGIPAVHVACWTGAAWDSLGPGLGHYANEGVLSLSAWQDRLIAGGAFPGNVATWKAGIWYPVGSLNGYVSDFSVHGGRLYAGGWFERYAGTGPNGVTRWAE